MDVENQEITFKYAISHNAPINTNKPKIKQKKKTPYVHILTKYQDNASSLYEQVT